VVIGGGDSAMEDALVLARTSSKVTVIHRREEFRASKILAQRVLDHPLITVRWNTVLQEIVGKVVEQETPDDGEDVNLDDQVKTVKAVKLMNIQTQEVSEMNTDAVFVAIGHTPTTKFMEGVVEFDDEHPGYLKTVGRSTKTTVDGIFAAGDVSDAVYRQAITSAGSGAAAALDAERYLSEEGLGNEAAEMEAELMAELMMGNEQEERISYNAYADAGGRVEGMKESLSAAAEL
jgi:thioredoxin reductase